MKPGTEMDYKQGQTTLVLAENEGSIYRHGAEVSTASSSKRLVMKVVLGLVALTLVVAVTLIAVYLGGHITKSAVKESYFTFHMPDGSTIQEKITVTDTEEDIVVLGQDTRIIYDYKKGYTVTRTNDEGVNMCYVATFDRTRVSPPDVSGDVSMLQSNVTVLPETDYYIQKNKIVDTAILSPRSRDMCQGLPVYWITRSSIPSGGKETHRQRRGCRRVCRAYCSCCPRDCGVRCSIECSW